MIIESWKERMKRLDASKSRARTVPGVLRAAATLIEKHGHSKEMYVDHHMCMCMSGAIRVAVRGGYYLTGSDDDHASLLHACFKQVAGSETGVIKFNNTATEDGAIAALRAAAKEPIV